MKFYLILFFVTISLLFVSCANSWQKISSSKDLPTAVISLNSGEKVVYQTFIKAWKNNFSGLLVFKKEIDSVHIVLLSEMGLTMASYTVFDKKIEMKQCIEPMKNRILQSFLQKKILALVVKPAVRKRKIVDENSSLYKGSSGKLLYKRVDSDSLNIEVKKLFGSSNFEISTNENSAPEHIFMFTKGEKVTLNMKKLNNAIR